MSNAMTTTIEVMSVDGCAVPGCVVGCATCPVDISDGCVVGVAGGVTFVPLLAGTSMLTLDMALTKDKDKTNTNPKNTSEMNNFSWTDALELPSSLDFIKSPHQ
jgi:hypothetical protein